jgi:hypothetical protein
MRAGDCVHFLGSQHEHCKAGVAMAALVQTALDELKATRRLEIGRALTGPR